MSERFHFTVSHCFSIVRLLLGEHVKACVCWICQRSCSRESRPLKDKSWRPSMRAGAKEIMRRPQDRSHVASEGAGFQPLHLLREGLYESWRGWRALERQCNSRCRMVALERAACIIKGPPPLWLLLHLLWNSAMCLAGQMHVWQREWERSANQNKEHSKHIITEPISFEVRCHLLFKMR